MTSSANNRGFSRMGVDPTISGLVDGTDFPHSALFHALNIATQGNYAIIEGNDFDITQSDSSGKTQFSVAAGKVVRNGALQAAVSTANFTQGTPAAFEEPTSGFSYYLLVVNSSNALELKNNGGTIITDTVPNPATTDIPIAVLRLGAGETTTQRHVQFLTTTKTANSLSIARDNSGVYTEMGTISCDANSIDIATTNSNANINLTPHGTGDVLIGNLPIDGGHTLSDGHVLTYSASAGKAALAAPSGGGATEDADGDTKIQVEESTDEDKIRFDTAGSERMIIDNAGNVGIGTSSPSEKLHVGGNVLIEDPSLTGTTDHLLEVKSGSSATPDNARIIISADTDAKLPMLHIRDVEENSGTFSTHYSAYIALDRASAIATGSAQNDLLIANGNYNKDIHFCTNPTSNGTQAQAKMTIAANGNVGIGTTTPSETLSVSGGIRTSGQVEIDGDLNHDGSNVGFYGTAPASRQTVGNLVPSPITPSGGEPTAADVNATTTAVSNLETKLNAVIDALQLYGLIL